MSYCGMVYRIDFGALAAVRGCHDVALLSELSAQLRGRTPLGGGGDVWDEDGWDDDEDAEEVDPAEAARALIMGEAASEEAVDAYGEVFLALYDRLGAALDNGAVAPVSLADLRAVDRALTRARVAEPTRLTALFMRGLPVVELDSPEPFPVFGYLTPEEVTAAHCELGARGVDRFPVRLRPILKTLLEWLGEADRRGEGLVGVYG